MFVCALTIFVDKNKNKTYYFWGPSLIYLLCEQFKTGLIKVKMLDRLTKKTSVNTRTFCSTFKTKITKKIFL
jgi:hypothetical protein